MVTTAAALELHKIDLSQVTSTGFDRAEDINALLDAVAPVDLQGRDAYLPLPADRDKIGLTDEVGMGPEGYRDHISNVFAVDQNSRSPSNATEYISTYAVSHFGTSSQLQGPEEAKGYTIQLAVNTTRATLVCPQQHKHNTTRATLVCPQPDQETQQQ